VALRRRAPGGGRWTLAGARRPVYRAPNDIVELSADQRLDASDVVAGWSPLVRELLTDRHAQPPRPGLTAARIA